MSACCGAVVRNECRDHFSNIKGGKDSLTRKHCCAIVV